MNRDVTHSACLVFLGLVMERWQPGNTRILGKRVALQAKQVDLAALQHPRIRRPVRCMTGNTSLGFDWNMLKSEGSGLVGMALEADLILRRRSAQLLG